MPTDQRHPHHNNKPYLAVSPGDEPDIVEIEVQWDAGGALMLRQLADMLDPPTEERVQHGTTLADAIDRNPEPTRGRPTPALKFRRLRLNVPPAGV